MGTADTISTPIAAGTAGAVPPSLPMLRVAAGEKEVLTRLDEAARRGRLAGFKHGSNGVLFTTCSFSHPFDGELEARVGNGSASSTDLRFTPRLKQKLIWVYVIVLLVSIWPGMPLTKSLLATLVPSWEWLWGTLPYWYLPLSIIGAPWGLYSAIKKSRAELAISSVEMVGKIEKELGAQRVG
ncbi:MAG: hypothetical protein QM783_13755 [Phycisphaerales bacterium]